MLRLLLGASILLSIFGLLVYTVRLNPGAQASPKELIVVTKTRGHEEVKATLVDDQLRVSLKNNHTDTITAFAINFGDTTIKEDFAYSDVHFGIEPGDTFERSYAVSLPPLGSELRNLHLLTVLRKNGTRDGDPKVSREIKDERLGEKIQILRMLRILEKERLPRRDLKTIKSDVVAALDSGESETHITLSELEPSSRSDKKLSDDLRNGLQVGREKILRKFEVLEQLPTESREQGFTEFKERANKLFAKL